MYVIFKPVNSTNKINGKYIDNNECIAYNAAERNLPTNFKTFDTVGSAAEYMYRNNLSDFRIFNLEKASVERVDGIAANFGVGDKFVVKINPRSDRCDKSYLCSNGLVKNINDAQIFNSKEEAAWASYVYLQYTISAKAEEKLQGFVKKVQIKENFFEV